MTKISLDLNAYKIHIVLFLVSFTLGAFFKNCTSSPCKTREQLCSIDIVEIDSLRNRLKESETLCVSQIDTAAEIAQQKCKKTYTTKMARLESACNELDCLQCER